MLKVHQILTISLLLPLFLVGTFNYSIITFNFQLNRAYITEVFCINKDKPELACGGQCHFMQQMSDLKKAEDERSGDGNTTIDESAQTLYCDGIAIIKSIRSSLNISYPQFNEPLADGYLPVTKSPPRV